MDIIRYRDAEGQVHYGQRLSADDARRIEGELFGEWRVTGEKAEVAKLLAPVLPKQILCVGLNYRQHAAETGAKIPEYPILFLKAINSIQNPGDPIEIPTHLRSDEVDYEGELAVVIGYGPGRRICKNVSEKEALDFVVGYTAVNDVSARDWQKKYGGSQWCRGKSFDTFCPLGPALVTTDGISNPNQLAIRTIVNGETVQNLNTSDMIFSVRQLIEFLSGSTTLVPGTTILTGTPPGVGMAARPPRWLRVGDTVTVEIEIIGSLTNPVSLESNAIG